MLAETLQRSSLMASAGRNGLGRPCLRCSAGRVRILNGDTYLDRLTTFWNERALKYDLNDEFHPPLAAYVVDFADIQPGQSVLDVATGTGTVAFEACQRIGASGNIVGVDISENMIGKALVKAGKLGLGDRVSFRVGDAQDEGLFPKDSFDRILCSSAALYMMDPAKAAGTFRGWLKEQGWLVFNTPQMPMTRASTIFYELLEEETGLALSDAASALSDADSIRQTLQEQGFRTVEVKEVAEKYKWGSSLEDTAGRLWRAHTSSVFTPLGEHVTPAQLDALQPIFQAAVADVMQTFVGDVGVVEPYTLLLVKALK